MLSQKRQSVFQMASTLYCHLETLLCRGILEESIIRICHESGIEKFIQGISVW